MKDSDGKGNYTQTELITILVNIKDDMAELRNDLTKTQTLIRDYNDLRASINELRNNLIQQQTRTETQEMGKKDIGSVLYNKAILIIYIAMFLVSLYSSLYK